MPISTANAWRLSTPIMAREPDRALQGAVIALLRPGGLSRASLSAFQRHDGQPARTSVLAASLVLSADTDPCQGCARRDRARRADLGAAQLFGPGVAGRSIRPAFSRRSIATAAGDGNGSGGETLSVHHWAGTWWTPQPKEKLWNAFRRQLYRARYLLTRGKQLDRTKRSAASIPPFSAGRRRRAKISPCWCRFAMRPSISLRSSPRSQPLDYPKDASSSSSARATARTEAGTCCRRRSSRCRARFRDIVLLQKQLGTKFERKKRAKPRLQRERRSGLAKVRNHLDRAWARRRATTGRCGSTSTSGNSRRHRADADRSRASDRRAQLRADRRAATVSTSTAS